MITIMLKKIKQNLFLPSRIHSPVEMLHEPWQPPGHDSLHDFLKYPETQVLHSVLVQHSTQFSAIMQHLSPEYPILQPKIHFPVSLLQVLFTQY